VMRLLRWRSTGSRRRAIRVGLEPAHGPEARVGEGAVVQVHGVLRGDDDAHAEGAALLHRCIRYQVASGLPNQMGNPAQFMLTTGCGALAPLPPTLSVIAPPAFSVPTAFSA
jgi:hypothetical protein